MPMQHEYHSAVHQSRVLRTASRLKPLTDSHPNDVGNQAEISGRAQISAAHNKEIYLTVSGKSHKHYGSS